MEAVARLVIGSVLRNCKVRCDPFPILTDNQSLYEKEEVRRRGSKEANKRRPAIILVIVVVVVITRMIDEQRRGSRVLVVAAVVPRFQPASTQEKIPFSWPLLP